MASISFRSSEIHCDGCAGAIQRSLGRLPGVQAVRVSVADRRVDVDYDAQVSTPAGISERLAAAGYPAETLTA